MRFIEKAQQRLRGEESGFTLIELSSSSSSSASCSRSPSRPTSASSSAPRTGQPAQRPRGPPAVEAFYADNNTYVDMTIAALKSIDQAVNLSALSGLAANAYCIPVRRRRSGLGHRRHASLQGPRRRYHAPAGRLVVALRHDTERARSRALFFPASTQARPSG